VPSGLGEITLWKDDLVEGRFEKPRGEKGVGGEHSNRGSNERIEKGERKYDREKGTAYHGEKRRTTIRV